MAPRETVHVRLGTEEIAELDLIAKQDQRTRSDMIRVLLKEAIQARKKTGQ